MSSSVNPSLPSTVRCSVCGRENNAKYEFCVNCGNRLDPDPSPPPPPPPPPPLKPHDPSEIQELRDHISSLQKELEGAKAQASGHFENLKTTLTQLKATEAAVVAAASDHAEKLKATEGKLTETQGKLQEAEEKAKRLEQDAVKLAGKVGPWFSARVKTIAGILALIGSLSGYGVGRYAQPKDDTKANQFAAQVAVAQQEITRLKTDSDSATKTWNQVEADLKAQLEAVNQKGGDLTTKLNGQVAQQQQLEAQLTAAQRNLASARTQVSAANTKAQESAEEVVQLKAQQTALNQHSKELESTLQTRETEISRLNERIASLTPKPGPRSGTLTWSGVIAGKRKIEIKDGMANYGALNGALPRGPCTVVAEDPSHVELKTLPSAKNQWSLLAFQVSGTGNMQVRINWKATP
jgi:predicted  nucleic acid-binding Zn-ribbon protein